MATPQAKRHLKEKKRFERAKAEDGVRFHIKTGPPALFRRVRDILHAPCRLGISKHARERIEERAQGEVSEAMLEEIRNFDPAVWRLFAVSCGPNGRFRQTLWRVKVGGRIWTVVRGVNRFRLPSQLATAYPSGSESPRERKYAKKGDPFYGAVEELNARFLNGEVPPHGADGKALELQARCKAAFQSRKVGGGAHSRPSA